MKSRKAFLTALVGAPLAVVAGKAAATFDPEGEPIPETSPLIVMNGGSLSNFRIDGGMSRREAKTLISVTGNSAIIGTGSLS